MAVKEVQPMQQKCWKSWGQWLLSSFTRPRGYMYLNYFFPLSPIHAYIPAFTRFCVRAWEGWRKK